MDRPIEKKHPLIRFKYYIAGGVLFIALLIYVIVSSTGSKKLRVESENLMIEQVTNSKFLEYVDVEGLVQPILTIRVNTQEAGSVDKIVREEGTMVKKGDTILILTNPDLIRTLEDQRDDFEKQMVTFKEREIEMDQKTLTLKQQTLQTVYELNRLRKNYTLAQEEFKMGVKSKAELEVARDEYEYKSKTAALQLEGLKHDSTVNIIRRDLMKTDVEREQKKYKRSYERLDKMIVRAPIDGQLSSIGATPGQLVSSGANIAEIKVLDQFKVQSSLSEYYIDRITIGLPAAINYQNKKYPLKISKLVPEVKERMFPIDLVFTDVMPDNVRIGKSFRVQIELGQPEDAVTIPRGNFFQATGGQWIYKLSDNGNRAYKVPVSIGRQNPQQYEIISGLKAGDQVIVSGYDNFGDVEELILK